MNPARPGADCYLLTVGPRSPIGYNRIVVKGMLSHNSLYENQRVLRRFGVAGTGFRQPQREILYLPPSWKVRYRL